MNCNNFLMLLYCIHLETKMTHVYTFFYYSSLFIWNIDTCGAVFLYYILFQAWAEVGAILTDSLKGKKGELKKQHSIRTHNKDLVIL